MHMQGAPRSMQQDPQYTDVVAEVREFLLSRVVDCERSGIARERIVVDPGIGFGKRLPHNLALLAALPEFLRLQLPLMVGVSRKSLLGVLLGRNVDERLAGGVALATASVLAGASMLRVHDVAETVDAIKVVAALQAAGYRTGG
jgi:dihydropteroate synthase